MHVSAHTDISPHAVDLETWLTMVGADIDVALVRRLVGRHHETNFVGRAVNAGRIARLPRW